MVLNARQRHEERRCLPPGTNQRNQKVLQHLGLAHCVAMRQRHLDWKNGTISSKKPALALFKVCKSLTRPVACALAAT